MRDSLIRPMKGILSPMNALQYHSETKRRVFSQYTERKKKRRKEEKKKRRKEEKKKRSRVVLFFFCRFRNVFLWYGTKLTPIDSRRGFIIKVKTVEIRPNSTITVGIPRASASLHRICISGNERSQSHLFQNHDKTKTKWIRIEIMLMSLMPQAWCLWRNKPTNKQTKQETKRTKT